MTAAHTAAYRARQKEKGLPDVTRRNKRVHDATYRGSYNRPFVGCDGEGCGTDDKGRQLYKLFRMGDRDIISDDHLSTYSLLNFICDAPRNAIYVGFSFGYDVTMILRDLSETQQRRLFEPKIFGEGKSPFVWYKEFDIDYLPKNYLRVRRVEIVRDENGKEHRIPIKESTRTIWEVFGFFQKSFVKVLQEFKVCSEQDLRRIQTNKNSRSEFTEIDQEVRDYCELECRYLAALMERLREYCYDAGIRPKTWSGAGKLAAAMHAAHKTPKARELTSLIPSGVIDMANMAYYGGRFEITRTGSINADVHEYDIRSAYPAAMCELPCIEHGRWQPASASDLRRHGGLFIAAVSFKKLPERDAEYGDLCGLPVRSKEGHLYWPYQGFGIYWSCEIKSAERLGHKIKYKGGWIYETECTCKQFNWVEELYNYRRSIGSSGPGYPIKLGINSLYGKLAQRKGNGAFANMVWAGLITAITRAKLNDAIALNPGRIVMIATDAVYSLDPIDLPIGDDLGQWEYQKLDGLFIVQPGLYWCPALRKKKSRGLSGKFFEEPGRTESFERAWRDFEALSNAVAGLREISYPSVAVPVPGFIGLKLALARNDRDSAGRWITSERNISFDYRNKRTGHIWRDGHIITRPKLGGSDCVSLPHREFLAAGGADAWEEARSMLEDQPDYVDLGIPYQD
jgi:hypothetical protein